MNIAGLPSLSLPCGQDREGLPIGLQLIGKPFGEAALYRAGDLAFEAVFMTDDGSVWITPGLAGQYQSDRPYQVLQP